MEDWHQEYTQPGWKLSDRLLVWPCAVRAPGDALRARALGVVGAGLEQPEPAAPLDERLAADRARLVQNLGPLAPLAVLADVGPVRAVGVARAGDERAVPACPLDQVPLPALRALLAGRLRFTLRRVALDVLALGIAGAADELAVAAGAQLQRPAAAGAGLVQQLGLRRLPLRRERAAELALRVARAAHERAEPACLADEVPLVAQRADLVGVGRRGLLSGAEHALQRPVEVLDHGYPLLLAALDLVQALFELGRVFVVGDGLEVIDHQPVDGLADARRKEATILDLDIPVRLGDGLHGRRVGRRAADAPLLELLDQRRLRVARRWLAEVLLGLDGVVVEPLALGEDRKLVLAVFVTPPDPVEAVERQDGPIGPEDVITAPDLHLRLVVDGGRHAAGHEPSPDEVVEPVLVGREVLADR